MKPPIRKGDRLGQYHIGSILALDDQGILFSARDTAREQDVIIRVPPREWLDNQHACAYREHFRRYAAATSSCKHPNLVTVLDFAESKGIPFIVTETIKGAALQEFLQKTIRFRIEDAITIVQQILAGLKHAHSKKLVHGSINPSCIYLLKRKQVRIANTGLTLPLINCLQQAGTDPELKDDRDKLTTYKAPEQVSGQEVDHRADLYSAGLILFDLLVRARASLLLTAVPGPANIHAEAELTPKFFTQFVPMQFVPILLCALERNTDRRFQSAAQFTSSMLRAYKYYLETTDDKPTTEPAIQMASASKGAETAKDKKPDKRRQEPVLNRGIHVNWPETVTIELELKLAEYIGPFARVLVNRFASQCTNLYEFIDALAVHIPDELERNIFSATAGANCESESPVICKKPVTEDKIDRPGEEAGAATYVFPEDVLERAEQDLAFYIGPIAHTLVHRLADDAHSRGELYRRLSEYIPVDEEKTRFLDKIPLGV